MNLVCKKCNVLKNISCFEKRENNSYRKQCKICVKKRRAKYYKNNKDIIKYKCRNYYNKNKNKYKLLTYRWISKNKEKRKEINKQSEHRRRSRKYNAFYEYFTKSDIVNKYGSICFYCKGEFNHIDHYIPLSKGGTHTLTNVRPSCSKCNLQKYNRMPEEFIKNR